MLLPFTSFLSTTCLLVNLLEGFLACDCYEGIEPATFGSVHCAEATEWLEHWTKFNSWHVLFRVSYNKGLPNHAASI